MQFISAHDVARLLDYPSLIDHLEAAFRQSWSAPARTIHPLQDGSTTVGAFGLMPGWSPGAALGAKLVTVFPQNQSRNLPTIQAVVVLFSPETGAPTMMIDGTELTLRRTAAASALASRFLSRGDSRQLLMIGAGQLAPHMVRAHLSVRPLRTVRVWARRLEAAQQLAARLSPVLPQVDIAPVSDLEAELPNADIVCCATASGVPLLKGSKLPEGVFVDLVGAHSPATREADDVTMQRARIYLDVKANCLAEAGDILIPLNAGHISAKQLIGDLADLCAGRVAGRSAHDEIIVFKSVGTAIEDLAAAQLLTQLVAAQPKGS